MEQRVIAVAVERTEVAGQLQSAALAVQAIQAVAQVVEEVVEQQQLVQPAALVALDFIPPEAALELAILTTWLAVRQAVVVEAQLARVQLAVPQLEALE
jgi:hypothetical protein